MIQPRNYCRQLVTEATASLNAPSVTAEIAFRLKGLIDVSNASQKFMFEGGFYDDDLSALNDSLEIRLPFPFIALEMPSAHATGFDKTILFAREWEDKIVITVVAHRQANGAWESMPDTAMPRTDYLMRGVSGHPLPNVRVHTPRELDPSDKRGVDLALWGASMLLQFLNILACCGNVRIESLPARKASKHTGNPLPFDSYKVLMVGGVVAGTGAGGGSHRSPREHLRRGHIRRLETGAIWVNAHVVGSRKAGGKITKDYRIKHEGDRPAL